MLAAPAPTSGADALPRSADVDPDPTVIWRRASASAETARTAGRRLRPCQPPTGTIADSRRGQGAAASDRPGRSPRPRRARRDARPGRRRSTRRCTRRSCSSSRRTMKGFPPRCSKRWPPIARCCRPIAFPAARSLLENAEGCGIIEDTAPRAIAAAIDGRLTAPRPTRLRAIAERYSIAAGIAGHIAAMERG